MGEVMKKQREKMQRKQMIDEAEHLSDETF